MGGWEPPGKLTGTRMSYRKVWMEFTFRIADFN